MINEKSTSPISGNPKDYEIPEKAWRHFMIMTHVSGGSGQALTQFRAFRCSIGLIIPPLMSESTAWNFLNKRISSSFDHA